MLKKVIIGELTPKNAFENRVFPAIRICVRKGRLHALNCLLVVLEIYD